VEHETRDESAGNGFASAWVLTKVVVEPATGNFGWHGHEESHKSVMIVIQREACIDLPPLPPGRRRRRNMR
jgi:hypothetical protein